MDNTIDPVLIRGWMTGDNDLFVIIFAYNSPMDEPYMHRSAEFLSGPTPEDALRKAGELLDSVWQTVRPEHCRIYQATPSDFLTLREQYLKDFPEGTPDARDIINDLLSREDYNGRSRHDDLRPLKVVSRPADTAAPEQILRHDVLHRIHGIVERIGTTCLKVQNDRDARKRVYLNSLPWDFFPDRSLFQGMLFRRFENLITDGPSVTLYNGNPIANAPMYELLDMLSVLDKVQKLYFTGHLNRDCYGQFTVSLPCADADAATGRKALVPRETKCYAVSLHFDVSYSCEVEASSEEEAIDLIREKAKTAPSADFEWLGETGAKASPTERNR